METLLADATDKTNSRIPGRIIDRLALAVEAGTHVAVLGLAYKPATPVIEASQSISIAGTLAEAGAVVTAFDPLVGHEARSELADEVTVAESIEDCLATAEVVLITTPDPAFRALRADDLARGKKGVLVLDFWRILDDTVIRDGRIDYRAVGRSDDDVGNEERMSGLWGLSGAESL